MGGWSKEHICVGLEAESAMKKKIITFRGICLIDNMEWGFLFVLFFFFLLESYALLESYKYGKGENQNKSWSAGLESSIIVIHNFEYL